MDEAVNYDVVLGILEDSRGLISESDRWTMKHYAVDSNGVDVEPRDPTAIKFCGAGALYRTCATAVTYRAEEPSSELRMSEYLLDEAARKVMGNATWTPISVLNDAPKYGWSAVLKAYDLAIERAKELAG